MNDRNDDSADDGSYFLHRRNGLKWALLGAAGAVAAAVAAANAHAGYGRCSACNCPGYTGSQWVCANCGHNYQTHW